MAKINTYKLWCQDLVCPKYYKAFMIEFLVDTLELSRQLPYSENNFTGPPTETMLKIGFADALLVQQSKDHRHGFGKNCPSTMWGTHLKGQPWIFLDHYQSHEGAISIFLWWPITSANSVQHIQYQPYMRQSICGKLDLTLWCPIGAAHRPRKEFRIKPVLRDVQTVEDQQDQNYSTPPTIR